MRNDTKCVLLVQTDGGTRALPFSDAQTAQEWAERNNIDKYGKVHGCVPVASPKRWLVENGPRPGPTQAELNAQIRAWAEEEGLHPGKRGRLRGDILFRWEATHPKSTRRSPD